MGNRSETILITGGYGFIGRNFIRCLQERAYRIVVLDPGIPEGFTEGENFASFKTDLSDVALIEEIIDKENPHYVLHLAGLVTASRVGQSLVSMTSANQVPLINMLQALQHSKQLELFLNFGSAEEYGPVQTPYTEEQIEHPQSPYALAKLHNTRTTTYFAEQYGIPALTLRPGLVYGPHQPTEKFLPSVILAGFKGDPIVMTPGLQTRDLIFVEDLARVVESFLKHPFDSYGGVFNTSTGKEISLIKLVELVLKMTGSGSKIETSLPYREKEAMRFVCDVSRTRDIIGNNFPWTSLEEGLEKTITHYRESTSEQ